MYLLWKQTFSLYRLWVLLINLCCPSRPFFIEHGLVSFRFQGSADRVLLTKPPQHQATCVLPTCYPRVVFSRGARVDGFCIQWVPLVAPVPYFLMFFFLSHGHLSKLHQASLKIYFIHTQKWSRLTLTGRELKLCLENNWQSRTSCNHHNYYTLRFHYSLQLSRTHIRLALWSREYVAARCLLK